VVLKKLFNIDLGISVPDTKAYITGTILIFLGSFHNMFIQYIQHKVVKDIIFLAKIVFSQKSWAYIQEIYSMLKMLPDRY